MRISTGAALIAVAALSGCVLTGKPVEIGKDTYSVTSSADGFRTGTAARGKALNKATKLCESQGKKLLLLDDEMKRTRMGIDTTVNMTFKCLAPDDPEYAQGGLK